MAKYANNMNTHMYGTISPKRRVNIQERRRKVMAMIQNEPGIRQDEIAKKLGFDRATISRDLKAMSEEIKVQNIDSFMVHRDRILTELHQKKAICEDRLQRLSSHPHQGSRWMEEWQKLLDKECKILGTYSPDRLIIKDEQSFSKDQEDASIDGLIKASGAEIDIIDLVPIKKQGQLPGPSGSDDDDDDDDGPSGAPAFAPIP